MTCRYPANILWPIIALWSTCITWALNLRYANLLSLTFCRITQILMVTSTWFLEPSTWSGIVACPSCVTNIMITDKYACVKRNTDSLKLPKASPKLHIDKLQHKPLKVINWQLFMLYHENTAMMLACTTQILDMHSWCRSADAVGYLCPRNFAITDALRIQ